MIPSGRTTCLTQNANSHQDIGLEWLAGRTVDHGTIGLEDRAVARTIPSAIRIVPGDGAALMRTAC
jgi:hypothetical protein